VTKFRTMLFTFMAAAILLSLSSATANAQKANPSAAETQQWRQKGPCADPWVSKAVTEYKGSVAGVGNYGDCEVGKYNNGSWSSYDDLYRGVQTAQANMRSAGVSISMTSLGGDQRKITIDAGGGYVVHQTVKLIGNAGGLLLTSDGASVVASGGGNFSGMSTTDRNEKRIKLGKSVLIIKKK
jgi:hypothetical protein